MLGEEHERRRLQPPALRAQGYEATAAANAAGCIGALPLPLPPPPPPPLPLPLPLLPLPLLLLPGGVCVCLPRAHLPER